VTDSIMTDPVILPREAHPISRGMLDPDSLKVLYRLHRSGYKAYLVGGRVRDLLLGRTPKAFDIGTDATPEQVKKLFRNCWLVGRRFRLAHVRFGPANVVEVATFRRHPDAEELPENPDDHFHFVQNVFGTPKEDAFRRDFTINALFYNIADFTVVDWVGGLEDLRARRLRVIGDPRVRFTEDPVRMLRALEFAARLDFHLDPEADAALREKAPLLLQAAPARVREEVMELFRHRVSAPVLRSCRETGLLPFLIPDYEADDATLQLLAAIDQRTAAGHPPSEHLALCGLYLAHFLDACPVERGLQLTEVVKKAGHALTAHTRHFSIAAGIRAHARDLMTTVWRLLRGRGGRGERRFLRHPGTREAIELLELWCRATGEHGELVAQWREALAALTPDGRHPPREEPAAEGQRKPRRRRRRRRKKAGAPSAEQE